MGYCVKGSGEVQEDENTDEARIRCDEEVIRDFNEGSLSTVMGSEARLEGFVELMKCHVVLQLCGNCSFQDLAQEWEV